MAACKNEVPRSALRVPPPNVAYLPKDPATYRPAIGLIGCGGISASHLSAYKSAGYNVVALCDLIETRAKRRQTEYFPDAAIYVDYKDLLKRDDIEVVDIATHPRDRVPIIEDALNARKHVLSQKPFVLDLDLGRHFAALADEKGVRLAVNQNGRWAPHFSYIREAIRSGMLGEVFAAHLAVHWDHGWIAGTAFDEMSHPILYDFAIHWFDIVTCFLCEKEPTRVYATVAPGPRQKTKAPMLAQVLIEYDNAQVSLVFDACAPHGALDTTYVAGTRGAVTSSGPSLNDQSLTIYTPNGYSCPPLEGAWFVDGFHGTMAELLRAIEEKREPLNSARDNLRGLALCFAAIASAETHQPQIPGEISRMPGLLE